MPEFWTEGQKNVLVLFLRGRNMLRVILSATMLAGVTVPAGAIDIAIISMQSETGEKSGHHINIPAERCTELLRLAAEHREAGADFWLTLPDPEFKGRVLEVGCVGPDGAVRRERASK